MVLIGVLVYGLLVVIFGAGVWALIDLVWRVVRDWRG